MSRYGSRAKEFSAGEDEVALTHSASEGSDIVAWSFDWREGDEVVISNTRDEIDWALEAIACHCA